MIGRRISRLLGWVLLAVVGAAQGLTTDSDQPIEIEADYAELDDRAKVAVYKGNVVAIQGSMRLTGDVLTIKYNQTNEVQEVLVDGAPAHFLQKTEQKEKETTGEASRIEYHAPQELLFLIKNAKLTQGPKVILGHRLEYDTKMGVLKGLKADQTEVTGEGSGRVRVILPPAKKNQ